MREAFGLAAQERLLLDERLYSKSWKSSEEKMGEDEKEEEDEEVTVEELARLVEESTLMGKDLRSVVRAEEPACHKI